ncbi:MAG: radical SAM protein [Candidatus Methanoperedens sp.]
MPVILKEGKNKFRILDPFYAGEWEMDHEALVSYLKLLERLEVLSLDYSIRLPERVKMAEVPEPLRTLFIHGLPLSCDFNIEKVLSFADNVESGIITPPIPIFEITPICNYKCPWCFIPRERRRRLSLETVQQKLVTPLLRRGTRIFVLTGGEPAADLPRLGDICRLITAEAAKLCTDVKIALLTNGYELTSNAKIYKEFGISSIQVSVISTDPKLDHQLRHAPTGIDSAKEAFLGTKSAVEVGIDVSFNFVLLPTMKGMLSNIHEIPEMVAYAKRLGVYMIRIVPVVQSGEASKNKISLTLDELRYARMLIDIEIKQHGDDLIIYSPIGYDVPPNKPVYCRAGNDVVYINSEGWIYPCNNLICPEFRCNEAPLGRQDILDIWDRSPILKHFRSPAEVCNVCLGCDLRTECGGQCRAQIYSKYGQIDLSCLPLKCYLSERTSLTKGEKQYL